MIIKFVQARREKSDLNADLCLHLYVSGLQPSDSWRFVTWAFGPGWYGTGLRP
jgi:hypothetical protein